MVEVHAHRSTWCGIAGPAMCPGVGVLKSGGGTFIGGRPAGVGIGFAVDNTGYFLLQNIINQPHG